MPMVNMEKIVLGGKVFSSNSKVLIGCVPVNTGFYSPNPHGVHINRVV